MTRTTLTLLVVFGRALAVGAVAALLSFVDGDANAAVIAVLVAPAVLSMVAASANQIQIAFPLWGLAALVSTAGWVFVISMLALTVLSNDGSTCPPGRVYC